MWSRDFLGELKARVSQVTVFPSLMVSFSAEMCSMKLGCGLLRR